MDIYSRGVVVRRADDRPPSGLSLIATDALPIYSGFSMTLVSPDGRSLNERIATIDAVNGPHRTAEYEGEHDLKSLLHAAAYHLTRIAELYVERNGAFEAADDQATTLRGNTSEPRVYYEVSAFLTVARSWFDALLRLLWKHYGPVRVQIPRHFTDFIGKPQYGGLLPTAYERSLTEHWKSWGALLNQYRNSAVHRAPLNEWGTTCWIEPHGERWALTVRLPSNPTAERADFDFDRGRDSLDYCHSALTHLADLAELTCELPPIRAHLDHPRSLK